MQPVLINTMSPALWLAAAATTADRAHHLHQQQPASDSSSSNNSIVYLNFSFNNREELKSFSSSSSSAHSSPVTNITHTQGGQEEIRWPEEATGWVTVVVALACLCVILGLVYVYLYSTRVNPRSNRPRKYLDIKLLTLDEQGTTSQSTHVFLFRR